MPSCFNARMRARDVEKFTTPRTASPYTAIQSKAGFAAAGIASHLQRTDSRLESEADMLPTNMLPIPEEGGT